MASEGLQKYQRIKILGRGSFGTVWQAVDKRTGETVAVKILKQQFSSWEECVNIPEVKVTRKVMSHANIVKLKDVIWEDKILYLVFEYMEGKNLYSVMEKRQQPLSEVEVKKWCFQVFQGLAYIHNCGFIHRDIKPDNLLLSKDNNAKIADFGLALDINSSRRDDYIGTRNYRAPEILLGSKNYGYAVDMWAMGATIAELLGFHILFEGKNGEDLLNTICSIIGSPQIGEWDEGLQLARVLNYKFPQTAGVHPSVVIPSASRDAIDLVRLLCSWDPRKRPSAIEVLRHPFLRGALYIPPFLRPRTAAPSTSAFYGWTSIFCCQGRRGFHNFYPEEQRKKIYPDNKEQMHILMQQRRNLLPGIPLNF